MATLLDICYLAHVNPFHDVVVYRFNIFNECLTVVFVQTLLCYPKDINMAWWTPQDAFDWGWVPISLLALYVLVHCTYQAYDQIRILIRKAK
jgi:hypothetical protein